MKTLLALVLALAALPSPLAAQPTATLISDDPAVSVRGFVLGAAQRFSAKTTFDAVFGNSVQPFWGGGVQIAFRGGPFVEVSASRFKKNGQRAVLFNGQPFRLGIPVNTTVMPVELSGGYRFHPAEYSAFRPYAGIGIGWYSYKEASGFSDPGDSVDTRTKGYLANVGIEQRVQRWIGVSFDVQHTHIPGVLGTGGISKDANEKDLGGISGRLRIVVGR